MVIDLDDDDEGDQPASTNAAAAPAEFEDDEEEVDPYAPYRNVLRYVDIPLGTAASRIAVPQLPKDTSQAPTEAWPSIYNDRVVVAAACSDLTLRLISAPLDPPAPEVQDSSKIDIQVVKIEGTNSHQQFVSDIAITHAGTLLDEQDTAEGHTLSRTQTRSQPPTEQDVKEGSSVQWSLLVASISCTGAGLLLVHQVPLRDSHISPSPDYSVPIRRTYFRTSSMGANLSFNSASYPAERHTTLLVTLPSDSTVKIYQVFPSHSPKERRGSNATDSSVSTTRSTRTFGSDRGKFLFTFLPPFDQDENAAVQRRKQVLDAQWVAGGRAVVALLADGEWGIWDLEAVGPASSTSGANLLRGQGNISGIQGGSMTRFAARSNVSPYIETKQKASNTQPQPTSGSLVPMTPSTRKVRSEGLFQGSKLNTDTTKQGTLQHGAIYVEEMSSNRLSYDESVLISYGGENHYLSSILSFWKGETKPVRMASIRQGGQASRSISLLPSSHSLRHSSSVTSLFDNVPSTPDFLIQTSNRLIFSLNPLSSQQALADPSSNAAAPSDQTLLASGDLDVDGMDRMLDGMGNGDGTRKPMNLFTKSVGFRISGADDDGDVDTDMAASPTPTRGLRITNGKTGSGGGTPVPKRRIFT